MADAENYFKVNVFNACLDFIISQLSLRFSALRTVANLFRVVQPHILATEEKNAIYEGAQRLVERYKDDLSPALPQQLIAFSVAFKRYISGITTVQDLDSLFYC